MIWTQVDCQFRMRLPLLPVVVFDQLFKELGLVDLVNLSYTCKSLHEATTRFLYSQADQLCEELEILDLSTEASEPLETRLELLEQALLHNPRNAQFLHSHTSFDIDMLKELWQHTPLTLKWLQLPSVWFESSDEEEIKACVLAKHPDTSIKDIIVGEDEAPETGYLGFFRLMHTFFDLRRLTINLYYNRGNEEHLDPDELIRDINCPNLEELILTFCKTVVSLEDHLPSLKLLVMDTTETYGSRCAFSDLEKDIYTKDQKWDRLNALYTRGVHLSCPPDGLYGFVVQYATQTGRDPSHLIRWLLKGESYFYADEDSSHTFWMDLMDYK
jgi:hypothetical protein